MYWEQEGQYPLILGAVIDISVKSRKIARHTILLWIVKAVEFGLARR